MILSGIIVRTLGDLVWTNNNVVMKNCQNIIFLFFILFLIPFQLPAQEYWAGFSNVKYDGENFYAVANQLYQVVKLDKQGSVIDKFGRRGEGPSEFSSDDLKLVLDDTLLYILDTRGFRITLLDKKSFKPVDRKKVDESMTNLIFQKQKLYGSVLNLRETEIEKIEIRSFRKINSLDNKDTSLFKIKNEKPINPFYDSELVFSNNDNVLIAREGKSDFTVFNDDSLYQKRIPYIEALALGQKITGDVNFLKRPGMDIFWKKKIMPEYMLIKSGYLDEQKMYFQVHSYKEGNALLVYDIAKDRFSKIGSLSNGKLLAVDDSTVFTMDGTNVHKTSISKIQSCSNSNVTFYLGEGALNEQCSTCRDSFFKWYNYLQKNNIPIRIVLEDNSWFGEHEVSAETMGVLKQWNLWGEIRYNQDCENCFESSLSAVINGGDKTEEIHSFPASISVLKEKLYCVQE